MGKAARIRAWGDGQYAARIRELPCAACGRHPVEAHHVKSRGAGGTEADLVPLCAEHHSAFHNLGRATFAARFSVDLPVLAESLWTFRHEPLEKWRLLVYTRGAA